MNFQEYLDELESKIEQAYTQDLSLQENEKLSGEFLQAQFKIASKLRVKSLDARMKKAGMKAIRSAVYLKLLKESDKKPTESNMDAIITTTPEVSQAQDLFDSAEVESEYLERMFKVCESAHVFFRQQAKSI
jgi:hypothetical protein